MSASGNKEDVGGRVKPGHDGRIKLQLLRIAGAATLGIVLICGIFAAWVASLGPLPFEQARQISTTIVAISPS